MASRKVAVVVGAGPGIGAAVARRFAKEGYTVALFARKKEKLQALKEEIEKETNASGKVLAVAADVGDAEQVQRAFDEVRASVGDPEVLIFNAAGFAYGNFLDLQPEKFTEAWKVSALGAFLSSQQVLRPMVANKKGTIIFTGATASLRGSNKFAAFASSKFAVRGLAQSIAREFGPQGVHVAHVIVDGGVGVATPEKPSQLLPEAIADTYWHLHTQHHTAWTFELDLRPDIEKW